MYSDYNNTPSCSQYKTYTNCKNRYKNHDGPWLCCANYYDCVEYTTYINCYNQVKSPKRNGVQTYYTDAQWIDDEIVVYYGWFQVYQVWLHMEHLYQNLHLGYNKLSSTDKTNEPDLNLKSTLPQFEYTEMYDYRSNGKVSVESVSHLLTKLDNIYDQMDGLGLIDNTFPPSTFPVQGEKIAKQFIWDAKEKLTEMDRLGNPDNWGYPGETEDNYQNYANCHHGSCIHVGYEADIPT